MRDPATGRYRHGWFSRTQSPSSSQRARANGWTMMAKTELLQALPEDHPRYEAVRAAFREHAAGLLPVQAEDGRWHQVLDDRDTYLDTSATAMFVRAFAEGVRQGWLPRAPYRAAAEKGWAALARQVRADGQVEGIVRGTPILYSDRQYDEHPTRLNDPRGLGAVLYAAAALEKLLRTDESPPRRDATLRSR
jgi:rhamnogalacturonyl hydrolase YesR